jgi:hypothetical protein
MWLIQEPNKVALWNKQHFEERKTEIMQHVSNIQYGYLSNKYLKCSVWRLAVRLGVKGLTRTKRSTVQIKPRANMPTTTFRNSTFHAIRHPLHTSNTSKTLCVLALLYPVVCRDERMTVGSSLEPPSSDRAQLFTAFPTVHRLRLFVRPVRVT